MRGLAIICIVVASLLTGCTGPREEAASPLPVVLHFPDTFRTLVEDDLSGSSATGEVILDDVAAWTSFWDEHATFEYPNPPRPDVDFAEERVVGVLLGQRENDCWHVEVLRVHTPASRTLVEYVVREPSPETACRPFETKPLHLVAIERADMPIEFVRSVAQDGVSRI